MNEYLKIGLGVAAFGVGALAFGIAQYNISHYITDPFLSARAYPASTNLQSIDELLNDPAVFEEFPEDSLYKRTNSRIKDVGYFSSGNLNFRPGFWDGLEDAFNLMVGYAEGEVNFFPKTKSPVLIIPATDGYIGIYEVKIILNEDGEKISPFFNKITPTDYGYLAEVILNYQDKNPGDRKIVLNGTTFRVKDVKLDKNFNTIEQ